MGVSSVMISILRSISIRIPLMIYGLDVEFEDDITIQDFVERVDDQSWNEFMPKGVTKELFLKFEKYYDHEVFIEAGHIIRRKVEKLDREDPLERTRVLAEIFGTFRNPDKETVLTPWRVVNLHFGKTFGGLSFYDEDYHYTTKQGVDAQHWIQTDLTDQVFYDNTHILEINSKTGLYPLYATTSLYYLQFKRLNENTAGKFNLHDEQRLWADVLKRNIFVIAKTPMAKWITKRTLVGYHDYAVNVECIDNLVEILKDDVENGIKQVKGVFGKRMKFDAVVGNPPYQDTTKGDNDKFSPPIYHYFMELAYKISDKVTLITPARFLFQAGSTPKEWNDKILADKHFKIIYYEEKSTNIFPRIDIKGGVVITYRDAIKEYVPICKKYDPARIYIPYAQLNQIMNKVIKKNFQSFSDIIYSRTSYRFTELLHEQYPEARSKLSKGHAYDVSSNIFDRLPEIFFDVQPNDGKQYILLIGRKGNKRVAKYIRREYLNNVPNLDKFKVFMPQANGSGILGEPLSSPMVEGPAVGSTETFLSIGAFDTRFEAEATLKYIKTKFVRVMLGILKVTQNGNKPVWRLIPLQNFSLQSDIQWNVDIAEIDEQLYKKYELTQDEIAFIESHVQEMK